MTNFINIGGGGSGGGGSNIPAPTAAGEVFTSTGNATGDWEWLPASPIIESFTGFPSILEVGNSDSGPTLSATYNVTPAAATVSWTNPTGGPQSLTTPFTSVTLSAVFTDTVIGDTSTVTLTATNAAGNASSTQTLTWAGKVWSGVGTAGATGLNGSTGGLSGATGTLTGNLQAQRQETFSVSPANQKTYFASPVAYGTATFKDAVTGFVFSMLSPTTITVVNSFSVSESYYLWESTQLLNSSFSVAVS